jgi:hypothetical protein
MKKKALIKEAEIEDLVKNVIKEYDNQLKFDFEDDEDTSSVLELAREKYNEIVGLISQTLTECPDLDNEECYNKMDSIYETIFNTWKELDKLTYTVGERTNNQQAMNELMEDFNMLESDLVDYLEVYKEYQNLKNEFDRTKEVIMSRIKKGE